MDFIEANGVGLRCELSGGGDRTLVLVHEMGGSLESWDDVAPRLAKSRRVLRYDTRGAGLSQKIRGELTLDMMADDIAALLDRLGIAGKVALAGVAVGGAIALHFAARYPERTSAVAVGSPATGIAAERRGAALERLARIEASGMAFAVEDSMLNGYAPELRGDIRRFERFRTRWLGNDPSSYATIWRMLAAADMQDELARLTCPVLVIGGSLDRVRPPPLAESVARTIPGARYVEIRTGHYMAVQTPDLLSDCIDEFLNRSAPDRTGLSPQASRSSRMNAQPAQQIPGIYHRKIGDITVTAVSDGYLDGTLEVMRNVDVEKARQILTDSFRPARRTSVNTFLIHSKGRIAIVDTGSGNYLQPTAGFVQRNLALAGIDAKSIDTVLLTHMHPDHSAGLTDMSNGQLLFPNAELVMHENELAHWFDDGAMAKVDERSAQLYFLAGREQVAPYKSRTRLFREGEVFPGVTAVPSLGHTPGHTAYLIASGKDQLMVWGDTVHVPEVQTAFPEAGMAFDTDLGAAAAARKRMFDRVSADGILIAGMHLHFPAFSRLARRGEAYALYPEAWVHSL